MSWRSFSPILLATVPVLAGAACSSTRVVADPITGPVARFSLAADIPSFMDVPFPSDIYLTNGRVVEIPGMERVFTQGAKYLSHELAKMDGFSRVALALFFVDDLSAPKDDDGNPGFALIDKSTLPADETACASAASSVFLVDLQSKTRVPCRAQFHFDAFGKARPVIAIGPARGVVLEEGHRYAAVLTSRVKDKAGHAVGATFDFTRARDGGALQGGYADAMPSVKTALAGALDADKTEIVAMAAYTTNKMTSELFAMRERLEDAPAPALAWDAPTMAPMGAVRFAQKVGGNLPAGFTASLDDLLGVVDLSAKLPDGSDDTDTQLPVRAHDKIAALGTAVFDAANFLQVKPGGYAELDHATFLHDPSGAVITPPEKPTAKIWVTFTIPTAPMPADGYPVVVLQHGLNGSRLFLLDLANAFAAKGWVVAAIDSVTFGARAPEDNLRVDATSAYAKAPGSTYRGPDGFADPDAQGNTNQSNDLFGLLKNLGAVRDQFRQAAIDTAQLVKVLRSPSLDLSPLKTGVAAPKLDPSRIAYVGDSLGAIQGALAAAIEPNVKHWTLNVGGGGLILEIASHGPAINALLRVAAGANFGFLQSALNESHPLVTIAQTITDAGDPLNYASLLITRPRAIKGTPIPPRNILQFEVIYDELVANEANEALARAGGWGFATPNVGSNAGLIDFKNPSSNPSRVPLRDAVADASGAFHDTPVPGTTAIIVQQSPAQHGSNIDSSRGQRTFAIPYGDFDSPDPFHHLDLDKYFKVRSPYRETIATVTRFFDDGFQGKVPNVAVLRAPVRDLDDDGTPDDRDPDPANPNVK